RSRWRHDVLSAVESRFVVVVDREKEILWTRFCERRDPAIARLSDLVERVCTRKMDDVNGRFGHLGDCDSAMNAFCFGDSGACERVILRCGATFFQRALDDLVDDDSVFGVHADQSTACARG